MDAVLGRDSEVAALDAFVQSTSLRALLLEGPAGIGKTTLWLEGVRLAREGGARVLVARPGSEETRLSFAGLADLLGPVLDELVPGLPAPQRRALEVALLLRDPSGAGAQDRAVFAAVTTALRGLASSGPLFVAVDDVQWLDAPSASALAFALARLQPNDPVAFLVAHRADGPGAAALGLERSVDAEKLTRVPVGRLSLGAISKLLRERLGTALPRPTVLRIDELSAGNPFYALELGKNALDGGTPAPPTLGQLLGVRFGELPDATKGALLLVAAAGETTTGQLGRALGADPWPRLRPALAAGLVVVEDDRVAFSHPLHGEAVYSGADSDQRRTAHRKLASVGDEPEQRARHLARALDRPDATAAEAIEEAASVTRLRGARSVSAELFEAAARLTPPEDAPARARRLLQAARATYEAGDSGQARSILEGLLAELDVGAERTEAMWRLGVILDETGGWQEAMRLWQDALETATEQHLVAELHRSMAMSSVFTGSLPEATLHADAAVAAAEASGRARQRAYAAAMRGFVAIMAGDSSYRAFIERALELEPLVPALPGEWSPTVTAAECARLAHDLPEAQRLLDDVLEAAVESGDANLEQWAAFGLGDIAIEVGDLPRADALVDTVLELAEQTEVMRMPALRMRANVDTLLGRVAAAQAAADESLAEAERLGERLHEAGAHGVLAFLALSQGDPAGMADHLLAARRIAGPMGIAVPRYLRPYLDEAEAAAAAGRPEQAEEALRMFETRAPEPPEWLVPLYRRACAVVRAQDKAHSVAELEAALAEPTLAELPFERGRTLLALGIARRRALERAAARKALTGAAALFDQLGVPLWAAQARQELARVGGRAPGDTLTTAERRIAELAADGSSNKEIAAALFVSVKTVEAALSRVYRKLGVRGRAALGRTLAEQTVGESPLSAKSGGA
ncbi:MAG TPA: AAA family ATPase [Gaiellaceae bacterium]